MAFKVLSLSIIALCLAKASIALIAPHKFYQLRRQQYASSTIPASVFFPPIGIGVLTIAAWYATFSHYEARSWIVTDFLTVISLLAIGNLLRWNQHRTKLLASIAESQAEYRRQVDSGLLGLSVLLGLLGLIMF